jgi:hypothetical protein
LLAASLWQDFGEIRGKQKPATQISYRGSNGDDGHGTLGGYVIFGRKTEYRGVIETVIVLKQAA